MPYSFTIRMWVLLHPLQTILKLKMQETAPAVYSPYPRRLESLTICWCNYKGSTFSSVILRPWVLVESQTHDLPRNNLMPNQLSHRCAVVAYAWHKLTNATPETSTSFTDVKMGAFAAGETVHKIFRSTGEMMADGEGAFSVLYIGERSDELAGLTPWAITCMWPRLLSGRYKTISTSALSHFIHRPANARHLSTATYCSI